MKSALFITAVMLSLFPVTSLAQQSAGFQDGFDGTFDGNWRITSGADYADMSFADGRMHVNLTESPNFLDLTYITPFDTSGQAYDFEDVALEATVRITKDVQLGFAVRGNGFYPAFDTYNAAAIFSCCFLELTFINPLPFTVRGQDIRYRFEAVGEELTFSLWPVSDPTNRATLKATGPNFQQSGEVALWMRADPGGAEIEFDDVVVGNPLSPMIGDFDRSGQLDVGDINLLSRGVLQESTISEYDLNKDGSLNQADRRIWVEELKRSYFGDANLDGEFSSGDFVAVFTKGEYEDRRRGNSTWSEGDWDGDGDFTTGDFVLAFQDGGYEKGVRPGVSAVPEPTNGTWLIAMLACLPLKRR